MSGYVPKKKDFQKYNLGRLAPWCPLCLKNDNATEHKMERHYVEERKLIVFKCDRWRVAIRVDDPFVGLWEKVLDRMDPETKDGLRCPMPSCRTPMRYFATSVGFMKAVCPKKGCGAAIAASEAERKPIEKSLLEAAEAGEGTPGVDKVYTPEKPGTLQ